MEKMIYKNPNYSIEDRVNDLIKRMNLEVNVMQLCGQLPSSFVKDGKIDYKRLKVIAKCGYGRITQYSLVGLTDIKRIRSFSNEIQKVFVNETRLNIPVILQSECLSGYPSEGGTIFPAMINLAASWAPKLVEDMAKIIGKECKDVGINTVMSPVVDISRDPRWGRCYETFGEDVYLTTQMGINYVKAIQNEGVSCIAKHFLGYAETQGGLNTAVTRVNNRELYEVFATPFEALDKVANVDGMMASYSEIDGLPVGCNKVIINDLLRKTMNFKGLLTSDGAAIWKIYDYFKLAKTYEEAGLLAKKAGLDTEIPIGGAYKYLGNFVKNNQLDEQLIDESVKRVLAIKFKLGLFENPYIKENVINIEKVQEKRNLSEIIAEESIVLLEYKDNIFPLTKIRKIALIGPHADNKRYPIAGYTYPAYIEMLKSLKKNVKKDVSFNGIIDEEQKDEDTQSFNSIYSILNEDDWKKLDDEIHILDVIGAVSLKESLEKYYQIDYIKGCTLIGKDYDEIEESYNLAMKNDVIVVALGGNCGWVNVTSGEGKDRCKLNLPGIQEKLLEKLQMTNKPIVLVLYGGVYVIPSMKNIQAILYVGLPGPYSGNVISNIISGKVNPSGKLPISIPRSVGQIPIYYNHKVGSGYYSNGDEVMQTIFSGGYIDESYRPLYPFGFGLSYTKFLIDDINIKDKSIKTGEDIVISCTVKNIGKIEGKEVVQIYYYFKDAYVIRPNRQLIAFKKISLKPNEEINIIFEINTKQLGYYNEDMEFVVEPGRANIMVGNSSENIIFKEEINLVGEKINILGNRIYSAKIKV